MSASFRRTRQRDAIRVVLERARRPLRADEVLMLARREVPEIGLATVYRTLKRLAEDGILAEVKLRSGATRYEPASREHSTFFLCEDCERVFAVAGDPPAREPVLPIGFQLHRHELTFIGICAACARKTAADSHSPTSSPSESSVSPGSEN